MNNLMRFSLINLLICISAGSFGQDFSIYVSDAASFSNPPWQILKYDQNGQNSQIFISDSLGWPQDILFLEDTNEVLISNLTTGKINRYNASSGNFIGVFADSIGGPTRMKIGPDGYLYVLQWSGNGKVLRYDLNGTFIDEFTSTGVVKSIGIDWDVNHNLYVSSFSGDLVQKFDVNGIDQGVFVGTDLVGPTNIWFDKNGDLLVSDYLDGTVKRFDSNGNYVNNYISGLNKPEGIDTLSNGNILIGNGGTGTVKMYDSDGNFMQNIVSAGSGGLQTPNAVVVRYDSTLVLTDIAQVLEVEVKVIASDSFSIRITDPTKKGDFTIYKMNGSTVFEQVNTNQILWNATKVTSGTYLLKVQSENKHFSKKLSVIHE